MPRKTPLFGFNLFWHDEPIISIEDVNPNSSYGGALQADSQNTLNFNFKRMDFVLQSILDGTLAFNSLRTTQDVIAGRDVVVGRNLRIQGSLQLPRDETPTPHVILDFGDALAYAGRNDKNLSVTLNGVTNNQDERFNAFTAKNDTFDVQGANIYPARFVVSHADKLWETNVSAVARLLLVFDRVPTGLSNVTVEYSYDGITFPLSQTFLGSQLTGNASYLSEPMVVSQDVKAVRITLNGTNAGSNEFGIRRIALLSPAVPALKDVHADAVDPHVYGTVMLQGTTLAEVDGDTTNVGDEEQKLNLKGTEITFNDGEVWHEDNDGAGSGLDADLLDGLHASVFLKADGTVQLTGNLGVAAGVTIDGVDISALLAAFNSHTHNGVDSATLHASDIEADDGANTSNVQAMLEALDARIDLLSSGGSSLEQLLSDEIIVNDVLFVPGTSMLTTLTVSSTATLNGQSVFQRNVAQNLISLRNNTNSNRVEMQYPSAGVFAFVPAPSGTPDTSKEFYYDFSTGRWVFDEVPYVGGNPVFHAGNLDLSDVSGDFGVDGGTFVVNSSTNRVGVGTSSPATPLEVVGTVRATDFEASSGSLSLRFNGGSNLAFLSTRADSWLDTENSVFFQVGDGSDKIVFTGQNGALASRMQFTTSAFQVAANTHDVTPAPTDMFEVVDSTGSVRLAVREDFGIETPNIQAGKGYFDEIELQSNKKVKLGNTEISATNNFLYLKANTRTFSFGPNGFESAANYVRFSTAGTSGAPTYSFQGDTNTGMYQDGEGILAFATGGKKRAQFDDNGLTVQQHVRLNGTSNGLLWADDPDTGLFRTAADTLRLRAGNQNRLTVTSDGVTVTGFLVIPAV